MLPSTTKNIADTSEICRESFPVATLKHKMLTENTLQLIESQSVYTWLVYVEKNCQHIVSVHANYLAPLPRNLETSH